MLNPSYPCKSVQSVVKNSGPGSCQDFAYFAYSAVDRRSLAHPPGCYENVCPEPGVSVIDPRLLSANPFGLAGSLVNAWIVY